MAGGGRGARHRHTRARSADGVIDSCGPAAGALGGVHLAYRFMADVSKALVSRLTFHAKQSDPRHRIDIGQTSSFHSGAALTAAIHLSVSRRARRARGDKSSAPRELPDFTQIDLQPESSEANKTFLYVSALKLYRKPNERATERARSSFMDLVILQRVVPLIRLGAPRAAPASTVRH
ncbi:hypothetical protein EVAR_4648_1 [Eumeta japonica]|uniref:Uncharacterized protein n=1 Tax=Eumeta variegata TaxID=151549 RepID=A0A4C1YCR9_EUMVA|nr:hypothetical protein EVAR_4648_1 [Eumeta japonica]